MISLCSHTDQLCHEGTRTGSQEHWAAEAQRLIQFLEVTTTSKKLEVPTRQSLHTETRGLDSSDATDVGDSTSAVSSLGVPLPGEESLESQNNCIKPHNLENKLSPGFQLFSQNFIITYLNSGGGKKTSTSHMVFNVGSLTLQSA